MVFIWITFLLFYFMFTPCVYPQFTIICRVGAFAVYYIFGEVSITFSVCFRVENIQRVCKVRVWGLECQKYWVNGKVLAYFQQKSEKH